VNGFRMEQVFHTTGGSAGVLPVLSLPIALMLALVGAGFLLEALRTATRVIS